MHDKVPVPTDNIYKFYALFSLVLFIFAVGSTLYVNRTSNDFMVTSLVELETLKQEKSPTAPQLMRRHGLERLIEVNQSDKQFFMWALAVLASVGVSGGWYGFRKWHTEVQPLADETVRVQLEIARLQLEKLRRENAVTERPEPPV